ncbi:MAG: D-alanyl-D-alanine carboxypeptidase family protein [Candidatus Nanoarchaeia archaeon]
MKKKQLQTEIDLNVMDGLYTSRVILNQEIEPNYRVYDSVIAAVNTNDQELLKLQLAQVLSKFYSEGEAGHKWVIIINEECFAMTTTGETSPQTEIQSSAATGTAGVPVTPAKIDACEENIIDKLPKITIPNPAGKNIMFLAKPYSSLDSQNARVYGYRAGLLKGYTPKTGKSVAPDGTPLQKIENIPNVVCDESDTTVGKICSARPELIMQLKKISAEELQPKGEKLVITQAFRSYEIQKNLYEKYCREGKCDCSNDDCALARNPDKLTNPSGHLDGTAIDVIIYTKSGKKLNGEGGVDPALAEDIMCSYGFVRWKAESWHFEYGSTQWMIAERERDTGKTVCTYGSG